MRVFVSHSMKDQDLLNDIKIVLEKNGLLLLIAEHNFSIDQTITEKIKGLINSSDIGLLLLTESGVTSGFVREEIGYLEALNIPSLIIYEKGAKSKYGGGFNYGKDYIELDPENPQFAFEKIKNVLLNHWDLLAEQQNKQAIARNKAFWGITAFLGILLLGKEE